MTELEEPGPTRPIKLNKIKRSKSYINFFGAIINC